MRASNFLLRMLFVMLMTWLFTICVKAQTTLFSLRPFGQTGTTYSYTNTSGASITLRITAQGGGGGNGRSTTNTLTLGSTGATMRGDFVLANGQTILCIAGGMGGSFTSTTYAGGGGGAGSGVINSSTNSLLMIAAGGTGAAHSSVGLGGSAATNGNGSGGGSGTYSTGGGGVNGAGAYDNVTNGCTSGGGQVSLVGLSTGGNRCNAYNGGSGASGMGGGGGASDLGGGGGGHTGGSGGSTSYGPYTSASSFNVGTNQVNTNGQNGTAPNVGYVIVEVISGNPAPVSTGTGASTPADQTINSCPGATVTLSVGAAALNNHAGWVWYTGSCGETFVGTGSSITVPASVNTVYYVRGEGGITPVGNCGMISLNVSSISISTPSLNFCPGQNISFTASGISYGGSPTYQWKKNGINVGTNDPVYNDNALSNNDVITCQFTAGSGCMITSNSLAMKSSTVSVAASPGTTICYGIPVSFTANNNFTAGTISSYQWKKNGNNVGTSAATYTDNALLNADIISCTITNSLGCSTTGTVTMIVEGSSSVLSITSNASNPICSGNSVVFTATTPANVTTPVFQWKKNGNNVGLNQTTYSDNSLAADDQVQVVMSAVMNCSSAGTTVLDNTSGATATTSISGLFTFSTSAYRFAKGFSTPATGVSPLKQVTIALRKLGTGTASVSMQLFAASSSGVPTGTALSTAVNTVEFGAGTIAATYYNFNFTGTTLQPSTNYALVVQTTPVGTAQVGWLGTSPSASYTTSNGYINRSNNSSTNGTTYSSSTSLLTCRINCEIISTVNYSSNIIAMAVIQPSTSTTNISICANALPYTWNGLTLTTAGSQTAHFTNAVGCDSAATLNLTVNPVPATPTASVIQPTCTTATGMINVTAPLGEDYRYSIGGAYQSNPSFTTVNPGTYVLSVQSTAGCFAALTSTITVDPQPFIPAAPATTGFTNVCPYTGTGTQITYTASAVGATSYTWSIPSTNVAMVSGQGTANLTVTFGSGFPAQNNKQFRVSASSACGTSPLTIFSTFTQQPNTASPITGPATVCELIGTATTATYIIPVVAGASDYSWSIPAGTSITHPNGTGVNDTTVRLTFLPNFAGGSISVVPSNNCGSGGTRSLLIGYSPTSTPGLISGPTSVCANMAPNGVATTYSIVPVQGAASYNWTVPAGAIVTHPNGAGANDYVIAIMYPNNFTSGTISVSTTNGCGTSGIRTLSVTRFNPATPGIPDIIQTGFCGDAGGRVYSYTLAGMPSNTTMVNWTVPTAEGAVLVSGQGTTSITVSYPATAVDGNITLQSVSNCGSSVIRSIPVKLPACPSGFSKGTNNSSNNKQVKKDVIQTSTGEPDVRVYPNPTINDFKIQVLHANKRMIKIRIMDMAGREIKQFSTAGEVLNVGADLKAGTYIIEIQQAGSLKTVRLIKF